jgi:hypothetical protein
VLAQLHWRGTDLSGGELRNEVVQLFECDEHGQTRRFVFFDEDELDAAVAELEDRYEAGEGAPHAEMLRLGRRFVRATMARDWDSIRAVFEPDFIFVEHGPAAFGTLSLDEYMEAQHAMVELAPDVRVDIARFIRVQKQGAVAEVRQTSSGMAGGFTQTRAVVVALQREGRFARLERFPVDQLEAAITRFEELTR